MPLSLALHMRSYVSDLCLCVCGSGRVPCFSECNVSEVVLVMGTTSNLKTGRRGHTLTGTSTGTSVEEINYASK